MSSTDGERLPLETRADAEAVPRRSFFGVPVCEDLETLDAQVAFLGIPYDMGTSNPGARFGPNAIRDKNPLGYGRGGSARFYDIHSGRYCLDGVTMADCGNVPILQSDTERNFWRITRAVRKIVERKALLVAVGGDHAITAPVVRGLESFGKVDIVHFDAHIDYVDHREGVRWFNGTPLRRAAEFPWVGNMTHIGLRQTLRDGGEIEEALARGNRIVSADQFHAEGPEAAVAHIPDSDAPLYVTTDIDVLDPFIAPGTGTLEPGGLTYLQLRDAYRALARRGRRIIGIDLVEVSPPNDIRGDMTSRVGARLLLDFLAAIFP